MKKHVKTYSPNHFFTKPGFTLAEVLITLGIIGVVAAITIPILIANVNSKRFASQFKKTLSILNQSVKMAEAQYDLNFSNTTPQEDWTNYFEPVENGNRNLFSIFSSTLKFTNVGYAGMYYSGQEHDLFGQVYKITSLPRMSDGNDLAAYTLLDGSILFMMEQIQQVNCTLANGVMNYSAPSDLSSYDCARAFIDVNGVTGPNKEVVCSLGTTSTNLNEPCSVKNNSKDMGDIFPIVLYDGTVAPGSNAAKYVLSTAK